MIDPLADLDKALTRRGESITIRRYTAPTGDPRPKIEATVRAVVRPVSGDELVGEIDQTYSTVITSPTGLSALLPLRASDKVVIQGRERNIEFPQPIYDGDRLVRIVLTVKG